MTNLQTAIESIKAEIAHVQSGMAYYVSRVAVLEKTLAELSALDGASESALPAASPKKRKQAAPKASAPAKGKKPKAAKVSGKEKEEGALPHTGGDYWPNLISDQPKHASDVLRAAIDQLGFAPTEEQVQKFKQRQTFALNALVKAGHIKDQGKGRERVFFK